MRALTWNVAGIGFRALFTYCVDSVGKPPRIHRKRTILEVKYLLISSATLALAAVASAEMPREDPQVQAARILAEAQIRAAQIQAQAQADAIRRTEALERKQRRQQAWKALGALGRSLSAPPSGFSMPPPPPPPLPRTCMTMPNGNMIQTICQ